MEAAIPCVDWVSAGPEDCYHGAFDALEQLRGFPRIGLRDEVGNIALKFF